LIFCYNECIFQINIDYCYSTLVKEKIMLILRVKDDIIELAIKTQKSGFIIIINTSISYY